jgi:hypothetical protein
MDCYPDFDDVWCPDGLLFEHCIDESFAPDDEDGVLGDDPFTEKEDY